MDDYVQDSAIIFTIPNPDFISDSIGCVGQMLEYRPTIYQEAFSYEWDFGDGVKSSEPFPDHAYTTSGQYTICLSVSNGGSCDSTECRTDYIQIVDPKAAFDADTFYANCPPLLVQFSNLSTDLTEYIWDFGDGSGASELEEPGHVYTEPGVYDVRLIGVVSDVCQDTIQLDDFIRLEGPQGTFSMEIDSTCAPLAVNFFGTSIDDYKYVWDFGDGQLDSSEQRTISDTTNYRYFFAGIYLAKLILIDDESCVRTFAADDSIQVNESVIVQLAGDTSICLGDSTLIHATFLNPPDQTTYSWLPNQDLSCLACTTSTVSPVETAYYYFETVHQNGCVFRDSVLVDILPLPDLTIGKSFDTTVCVSDTVELYAISNALKPAYSWSSGTFEVDCENCDSVNVVLNDTSNIFLSVVDSFGCANEANIEIPVFSQHIFFAGEDQVICSGDSLLIEVQDLQSVMWPGNAHANCDTCMTTWIHPFETTQLLLDAIHPIGCPIRDTLFVRVRQPDEVDAGEDAWICLGESLLLEGKGFGSPTWHPAKDLDFPNEWMPTAHPDTTMTFVLVANEGHCSFSDTINITVKTKAKLFAEGDTICFGDPAQVIAFGDIDDAKIDGGDGIDYVEADSVFIFEMNVPSTNQYQIIGYLATCEPDTTVASIHVFPEIKYSLKKDILHYPNTPIPMKLTIDDPKQYDFRWFPETYFDCDACQNPNLFLDEKSTVHLTITNQESGCQIEDSIEVRILATCRPDDFIFVPNIFTPNQDGSNDQFRIYSAVHQVIDRIQLFDRWGNLVWATEDITEGWDGMVNGSPAPTGVYVYSIEGPCAIDQSVFRLKGDVTLIR
jgi:gliding motility-associated-like protein